MVHLSGFGRDDAKSFRARLDAAAARNDQAKDHADDFVGMTEEEARAHADELGLTLRLAPAGAAVTAEYQYGRVTGWLRDDVIAEVSVG
jgi:hypothetical protein